MRVEHSIGSSATVVKEADFVRGDANAISLLMNFATATLFAMMMRERVSTSADGTNFPQYPVFHVPRYANKNQPPQVAGGWQ